MASTEGSDHDPIPLKEPFELEPAPPRDATAPPAGDAAGKDTYDLHDDHQHHAAAGPVVVEAVPASDTPPPPADANPPFIKPLEPEEPTWPDTLGSICMILAACGLLVHGLVLTGYTLDLTGGWEHLWRDRPQPNYVTLIPNMMLETVLLCIELMLLYGGFAMKMRWISAVPTLRAWAMVKIVLVLLRLLRDWAVLALPVYRMLTDQKPDSTWGHYQTSFMLFWSFVMLAWGLLLPVFLLLMFKRQSVQDELATW